MRVQARYEEPDYYIELTGMSAVGSPVIEKGKIKLGGLEKEIVVKNGSPRKGSAELQEDECRLTFIFSTEFLLGALRHKVGNCTNCYKDDEFIGSVYLSKKP